MSDDDYYTLKAARNTADIDALIRLLRRIWDNAWVAAAVGASAAFWGWGLHAMGVIG